MGISEVVEVLQVFQVPQPGNVEFQKGWLALPVGRASDGRDWPHGVHHISNYPNRYVFALGADLLDTFSWVL